MYHKLAFIACLFFFATNHGFALLQTTSDETSANAESTRQTIENPAIPTPASTPHRTLSKESRPMVVAAIADIELTRQQLARLIQPYMNKMLEQIKEQNGLDLKAKLVELRVSPAPSPEEYEKYSNMYKRLKRYFEESVTHEWLRTKALVYKARQEGVTLPGSEYAKGLGEMALEQGVAGKDPVSAMAEQAGLSRQDFDETLRDSLLIRHYLRKTLGPTIPEETIQKVLILHPELYGFRPMRRQYQQLFKPVNSNTERETARTLMKKILVRAIDGESMDALAKEIGMPETVPRQRWVTEKTPLPGVSLHEAIWETGVGRIAGFVIESSPGFYIVKVLQEEPRVKIDYAEARPKILDNLVEKRREELALKTLEDLDNLVFLNYNRMTDVPMTEEERRDIQMENIIQIRKKNEAEAVSDPRENDTSRMSRRAAPQRTPRQTPQKRQSRFSNEALQRLLEKRGR